MSFAQCQNDNLYSESRYYRDDDELYEVCYNSGRSSDGSYDGYETSYDAEDEKLIDYGYRDISGDIVEYQ